MSRTMFTLAVLAMTLAAAQADARPRFGMPDRNGVSLNGITRNASVWNGYDRQGLSLNGITRNHQGLNGLSAQGLEFNRRLDNSINGRPTQNSVSSNAVIGSAVLVAVELPR